MGRVRLPLVLLTLTCAAAATQAQHYSVAHDNEDRPVSSRPLDYPPGDARRCFEVARGNGYEMQRFEALPGFGWDNLRNINEGQVVSYNYSTCRTTPDGRFLLPDGVSALPIKSSDVHTFAELITHWRNWTSSTSRSINVNAGLHLQNVGISGSFSSDYEDVKSKQIGDKSLTTRAELRYVRYQVQLQPDTPLQPEFKNRVLRIAAAKELGQRDQADYLAQLLVRDFGTHVVTRVDAGAALEQVDQVREEWVMSQQEHKSDILAAASASLFGVFHMGASYNTKTDQKFLDDYRKQRTSSNILTKGGPLFRPANFTANHWAAEVDRDLVALDRGGDPLYYVITGASLPELPQSTLREVYDSVKGAVEAYYLFNRHPGCLEPSSPNFAPSSNVEDGSCRPPPTNLTFGGVYQTCSMTVSTNGDLCAGVTSQVNPLTGGFSCPDQYEAVKLHEGTTSTSRSEHVCHGHWFWRSCHDNYYQSRAVFDTYWCVATGPVPPNSGYLFGGLYTSNADNLVTRSKTCPPTFFALDVASGGNLHVCISDDFEFGEEYSVPFGGFISCQAGNPLAVSSSSSSAGGGKASKRLTTANGDQEVKPSGGNLKKFFHDKQPAQGWPQQCPEGYSRHLALVEQGCQINYCVRTGSLAGPVLPPILRPPFSPAPPLPPPSKDNLVVFNLQTSTWKKNQAAVDMMRIVEVSSSSGAFAPSSSSSSSDDSSASSLSPGAAAGITLAATAACIGLATLAVLAVKAQRKRNSAQGGSYRRLAENPLLNARADDYGSVTPRADDVTVQVVGESGQ